MIQRRGWNEGSVAVEGAIALLVLIITVLGIIEFGVAFYNLNTMQVVMEETGRYAMVHHGGDTLAVCQSSDASDVENYANQVLTSYPVMNASINLPTCSGSSPVIMTITASFSSLNLLVPIPAMSAQISVPLT